MLNEIHMCTAIPLRSSILSRARAGTPAEKGHLNGLGSQMSRVWNCQKNYKPRKKLPERRELHSRESQDLHKMFSPNVWLTPNCICSRQDSKQHKEKQHTEGSKRGLENWAAAHYTESEGTGKHLSHSIEALSLFEN